jgi:hypothetical protein
MSFRPRFNPWAFGQRHRYFVTLFPNSYAPGINLIVYGLMPSRPMLGFATHMRLAGHVKRIATLIRKGSQ